MPIHDTDTPATSRSGAVESQAGTQEVPWWARSSQRPLLDPSQVRVRTRRGTINAVIFTLLLALGMWWVLTASEVKDYEETEHGFLAYKQSTNALIGGCGEMFEGPAGTTSGIVPDKDRVGISNRVIYQSIVPMFGEFWDTPAPDDQTFWARNETNIPKPENLLRNMWDGTMVVYYTSAVPQTDVETLKDVLTLRPELDIKVVPWDEKIYPPLPQNRDIAFATWNHSQSCHRLIAPALYDFREAHPASEAPGFNGSKPPVLSDTPPVSVVE